MSADVIDLFPDTLPPVDPLLGRAIAMDRSCWCGINIAVIGAGRGPHAAELRCRNCSRHWQWLSHADYRAVKELVAEIDRLYGAPPENFLYRIRNRREAMTEYDNTNRGALFKNEDKQNPKHADYNGSLNVNGDEFWLDAWIRTSKKGVKFMSLSVKAKNASKAASTRSTAEDLSDPMPF